jgi:hypothetical protein
LKSVVGGNVTVPRIIVWPVNVTTPTNRLAIPVPPLTWGCVALEEFIGQ